MIISFSSHENIPFTIEEAASMLQERITIAVKEGRGLIKHSDLSHIEGRECDG